MRTEVEVDRYLLRPEDAAHVLSIGRSKLYELLASGRLPSVTIDGCRRVRSDDIEAFVAELNKETSTSHRPSTVDDGDQPSGVIDLRVDQPLLFPDAPVTGRRRRPAS
jgi:excisionase family DNA binding protein